MIGRFALPIALPFLGFFTGAYAWINLAGIQVLIAVTAFKRHDADSPVSDFERLYVLRGQEVMIVPCVAAALWLGFALAMIRHYMRIRWLLIWACLAQLTLARVCIFCLEHFHYDYTDEHFPSVAEVSEALHGVDVVLYAPFLSLLDREYGIWALVLHSLVTATLLTGGIYALTRLYRCWCKLSEMEGTSDVPDVGGVDA
ncbi:MAG: hypothetical protein IT364_20070 [Candidatus Hydrogenedentes bacterium]|nr:hypothetical protein [Candidatus Hydrogenedentota bacterium]